MSPIHGPDYRACVCALLAGCLQPPRGRSGPRAALGTRAWTRHLAPFTGLPRQFSQLSTATSNHNGSPGGWGHTGWPQVSGMQLGPLNDQLLLCVGCSSQPGPVDPSSGDQDCRATGRWCILATRGCCDPSLARSWGRSPAGPCDTGSSSFPCLRVCPVVMAYTLGTAVAPKITLHQCGPVFQLPPLLGLQHEDHMGKNVVGVC